jgi:hypothetical protein
VKLNEIHVRVVALPSDVPIIVVHEYVEGIAREKLALFPVGDVVK